MRHEASDRPHLELAPFSERVLAFMIDAAPFAAGYWLTLNAFFPGEARWTSSGAPLWGPLWAAAFLAYQAFSSSEGRRSLGKSALGLRVVNLDNEPLPLSLALVRSFLYPVSAFLGLGFLWPLFNPMRQAWHDLAVGSVVAAERVRSTERVLLAHAGALACLALLAGGLLWSRVYEPRHARVMTVAYAHVGLQEIGKLQDIYHRRNGRYAEDLLDLASISGAPGEFIRDMSRLFDAEAGVQITLHDKGYTVAARARDPRRTLVSATHAGS